MNQLIECVPNFSEGRDPLVLEKIAQSIRGVEGVKLLDMDPGKATNRTVFTFVGEPEAVVEAAFCAIRTAAELIDMSRHQGEHPRMGATDVCPLIPIRNISLEETAEWARRLGERVGNELEIPVYLYEAAASRPERRNLATVRAGEYEGLPAKLAAPEWQPDFGPARFHARAGATAIGARDFLIAYNVNLNTTSVRRANAVAFDVREKGRIKREGGRLTGKVIHDADGNPLREPGQCKAVKAIGWYIEEYGLAQISMNLTDIKQTPLHIAFEACRESANRRGLRVTGSELIGMAPKQVLLDAGYYFLRKQRRSLGVSEKEVIKIAVKSLGLDELGPFDPAQKIIEYKMAAGKEKGLVQLDLQVFADETASESVAPGGGSISAYVGALGASLGTMVANLSSHRRAWDDRWEAFSVWAERGQQIKDRLLQLVDADTEAFNGIIAAIRLPKSSAEAQEIRKNAIREATKKAIEAPLEVMETAFAAFDLLEEMIREGSPSSVTDAAVGVLCVRAAILGAGLNVEVNCRDLDDPAFARSALERAQSLAAQARQKETELLQLVNL